MSKNKIYTIKFNDDLINYAYYTYKDAQLAVINITLKEVNAFIKQCISYKINNIELYNCDIIFYKRICDLMKFLNNEEYDMACIYINLNLYKFKISCYDIKDCEVDVDGVENLQININKFEKLMIFQK